MTVLRPSEGLEPGMVSRKVASCFFVRAFNKTPGINTAVHRPRLLRSVCSGSLPIFTLSHIHYEMSGFQTFSPLPWAAYFTVLNLSFKHNVFCPKDSL